MTMLRQIPTVISFVRNINQQLIDNKLNPLTKKQINFISIAMSAMILLGALNFSAICRGTLGAFTTAGLSWMLHHSAIPWSQLRESALILIFKIFNVSKVHIAFDDTDRTRSKVTRMIFAVFKTLNKKTGGFCFAQNIIFLVLVTKKFTIPIFFSFYRPDPAIIKWKKEDKKLKKKGIPKKDRPSEPQRNRKKYPTRLGIAINLLARTKELLKRISFAVGHDIKVSSIAGDAAYMSPAICNASKYYFPKAQFVSQLAKNQIVWDKSNKKHSLNEYFAKKSPVIEKIKLRGEEKVVLYCSARLFVKSHGKKLHI
jgi:hypothetical protein